MTAARRFPYRRRAVVLVILSLIVLVLFAGVEIGCPSGQCWASEFDQAGLGLAADWRSALHDALFMSVTWLGSLLVLLPLALLFAVRLGRRASWRHACLVPFSVLTAAGVAHLAKWWFARPRPAIPALIEMPVDWSYPSAHAMQATAFALALWWGVGTVRRRTVLVALWLLGLVFAVGASRIYLQVHFPTDVVFGILAGALCTLAVRTLLDTGEVAR